MSQKTPLVYIIVLAWNGVDHTVECLRSIQQSDYPSFRILLVDNASTDTTVISVKSEFPDVEVIANDTNVGYAEGNNIGLQHALDRGADFFFILNNDTVVDPSTVSSLVNATSKDPAAWVCAPALYRYSKPDEPAFVRKVWDASTARFRPLEGDTPDELLPTDIAPGCALFFGPEVFRKVGKFDSRFFLMWEDTDWCTRAVGAGCHIFIVPAAKVWHKESRSFVEGSPKIAFHYYFYRNHLLWIEKNLTGLSRWREKLRCWRSLFYPLHEFGPQTGGGRSLVFRARLLGAWHYCIRRFGPL